MGNEIKKSAGKGSEILGEKIDASIITPKEMLNLLKTEGIVSLEDFVAKVALSLNEEQVTNLLESQKVIEPELITKDNIRKILFEENPVSKKQPAFSLPVKIEGVIYHPSNIDQFDGQHLHYYVDEKTKGEGVIYGFTNKNDLIRHLIKVGMLPNNIESNDDPKNKVLTHWVPGTPSYYYEHINYSGARLQIDPGHCIDNLTDYTMSGMLWWKKSWNDQISSLKTGTYGAWLFEHLNFQGSYIIVGPNTSIGWIGSFWNGRISSIL